MITRIKGNLTNVRDDDATLSVGNFDYQVLIPDFVRRQLQSRLQSEISLYTVYYMEGNATQGKLTPRLVGFLSEVEREFFEMFCSVDGVGVRKALRAMVRPVQEVAALIADQNAKGLAALPGIGPSTAERIIAKLRRKMCKFALLAQHESAAVESAQPDVVDEAFQMLAQLGHSEAEARQLLDETLATQDQFKDVDALMHAIYETRSHA